MGYRPWGWAALRSGGAWAQRIAASNRTHPRMPLVSDITALLRLGYYGDTMS